MDPAHQVDVFGDRVGRFAAAALVLGILLLFVNPVFLGIFLPLEPDAVLYVASWDLLFFSLLGLSVAFIHTKNDRYRKAFLIAVPVGLLSLLLIELALSQWRLRRVDEWRPQAVEGVYQPHDALGWRPIPNGRGRHVSEGNFDATYEFDSLGRKEIPTNVEGGPTLHFFGDSYTFGHGVSNEETALNLLARRFAADRGYNVANHAVMAYGLEQMATSLAIHRDQVGPGDYVIFAPTSFDLTRNMIHKRFLCSLPLRQSRPVGALRMRIDGSWDLVDLEGACGWAESLFLQSNFAVGALYHGLRDRLLHADLIENAEAILEEAEALAEERGARFLVWFIAAPWECEKRKPDFDLGRLEAKHPTMLPHCPDESSVFPSDSHWNPKGNHWYARFWEAQLAPLLAPP